MYSIPFPPSLKLGGGGGDILLRFAGLALPAFFVRLRFAAFALPILTHDLLWVPLLSTLMKYHKRARDRGKDCFNSRQQLARRAGRSALEGRGIAVKIRPQISLFVLNPTDSISATMVFKQYIPRHIEGRGSTWETQIHTYEFCKKIFSSLIYVTVYCAEAARLRRNGNAFSHLYNMLHTAKLRMPFRSRCTCAIDPHSAKKELR